MCGVTKGVDEKIDKGVLLWFGHVYRMENDKIAKRVYVGECAGNWSVGRRRKKRKDKKTRKSRSEKKVVGFSSASLSPARKREAVTQGRTI